MKRFIPMGLVSLCALTINAEEIEFTPTLLISTVASQDLEKDAKTGTLTIEKMEAGFELAISEKLTGATLLEHDDGTIVLCEAFAQYAFSDMVSLTAGQLTNNCGDFTSEAIFDPLILDYAETNEAAVQIDLTGEKLYGGFTVYNGIVTDEFSSFVPMIGVNLNGKVDLKASARVELGEKNWVDYSMVAAVTPNDLFAFRGELYAESEVKPESEGKVLGYYGEIDIYPSERFLIFSRYDQIIDNVEESDNAGMIAIQAGAGYVIQNAVRFALSLGGHNTIVDNESNWAPSIAGEVRFEL